MKTILKSILIAFFTHTVVHNAVSQQINISFDLTNPEETIRLFKKAELNGADLERLLNLESTKALLKKMQTGDSLVVSSLLAAKAGQSANSNQARMQYEMIVEDLDQLERFVSDLKSNEKFYEKWLNDELGPYISKEQNIEVEIVGILGGHSTGYTFGDWDKFYISLHHMKGDPDFMLSIFKHELFHNIQSFRFDGRRIYDELKGQGESEYNADYVSYLLFEALYLEGTATYLDRWMDKKETAANEGFIDRGRRSAQRGKYIFYLFDRLIVDVQSKPSDTELNWIYNTFFTTKFDEAGYYMGMKITDYVLEKSGNDLTYYMDLNPITLMVDYLKYSADDGKVFYQFSEEFRETVFRLYKQVKNLQNFDE
ncbi:hypothetical protein [Ekhidna sp.]|uniref:hypothetical protein n=1 Tax=Ekhidna sp. TaxID=2608089 RepID=UPI003CCBA25D